VQGDAVVQCAELHLDFLRHIRTPFERGDVEAEAVLDQREAASIGGDGYRRWVVGQPPAITLGRQRLDETTSTPASTSVRTFGVLNDTVAPGDPASAWPARRTASKVTALPTPTG
jgi:hypothetical protein